jgi:photosystem II stability/assembly factor-like uncharacterized protein
MLFILSNASGLSISSETGEIIPGEQYFAPDNPTLTPVETEPERDVQSWSGTGPWGGNVRGLAADPADNLHLFAACGSTLTNQEGGVFTSTDGGINWQPTTLARRQYNAMAFSASQPGTVYAGSRSGLYKSTDNGASWALIGSSTNYILGVGVKANDGNTIVIGKSGGVGLMYSSDGGNNFVATNVTTGFMRQFAWSTTNPSRMYVVMGSSTSSLLTSTDGATWTTIGPAGNGWGAYISPTNDQFILLTHDSGIYRTIDGGSNWDLVYAGTFKGVTEYNGVFYATANAGGVYESNDNGLTWVNNTVGYPQSTWQTAASSGAGALFGHWGGIFRCAGYLQPVVSSHTGLNLGLVHGLAYYADTNELWGGLEGSGLYKSTDNGATWQEKNNGLGNWMVYELQPTNHQFYQSGRMLAGTLSGAYTSTDGGDTWSLAHWSGSQISACEVHPTNPDIYWLGNSFGEIRATFDGGLTFTTATGGAYGTFPRLKLGKGPTGDLRLFLFFQNGSINSIWYSDDLGLSFVHGTGTESTGYQPQISIRPALGTNPQIIYVSTGSGSSGNIFKSTDNGLTYTAAGMTGFSWSVLSGPGSQVLSGTNSTVLYSTDEATSSTPLTQNLEANNNTWAMVWGNTTNRVYIATRARGIMQNDFSATVYGLPTGLSATPGNQEVTLNWTAPGSTPNPVFYTIWRDCYPVRQISADQTTWTDTGLVNGQSYSYFVSVVYADDIQTSAVEIITGTPEAPSGMPPSQPQNVAVTISGNDINLDWDVVTTDTLGNPITVDGYRVYWSEEAVFTCDDTTYLDETTAHTMVISDIVDSAAKLFFKVVAFRNILPE